MDVNTTLLLAIPVSVGVGFVAAHLQAKTSLKKFMMTHMQLHARSMTAAVHCASAVARDHDPSLTDEAFIKAVIKKGPEFGLNLHGYNTVTKQTMNKDTLNG
jgi:hypothetical protein